MLIRINTISNFQDTKNENRVKNNLFSKIYEKNNKKKIGFYSSRNLKKVKEKKMENFLKEKLEKKRDYLKKMRRFSKHILKDKFIKKNKKAKKNSLLIKNFNISSKKLKKKNSYFKNEIPKFFENNTPNIFNNGNYSQISDNSFISNRTKNYNKEINRKRYLCNVYKIKKQFFSKKLESQLFSYQSIIH